MSLMLVIIDNFENKELNDFVEKQKKYVNEKGLSVRFEGATDVVFKYLQLADVFCLPSRKEGFGNVIIEVMACKLPPVVTYMDGVALESVTDGETGLIVHNNIELEEAVRRQLTCPVRIALPSGQLLLALMP